MEDQKEEETVSTCQAVQDTIPLADEHKCAERVEPEASKSFFNELFPTVPVTKKVHNATSL